MEPAPERDVMTVGGAPRSRSRRVLIGLLAGLTLLGAVAAGVIDRRGRAADVQAVEGCGVRLLEAVERSERRLGALTSYLAPAVNSSSASTFDDLYVQVSEEATGSLDEVAVATDRCREISVRWWRQAPLEARDLLIDFGTVSQDRLTAIGDDGTAFYREYELLITARERAQEALDALSR